MEHATHPWMVSTVYVGAVVGAGLASGREILQFFAAYGVFGLAGAVLAAVGFGWLGGRILTLCADHGVRDHRALLRLVLGDRIGKALDAATTLFLFLGLSVVLAGGGAYATEVASQPHFLGILALAGLTAVILLGGLSGLLWGNALLVPLLFAFCLALGIREAAGPGWLWRVAGAQYDPAFALGPWYLGAALYVGYNLLVAVVALCAAAPAAGTRPFRWGVLGGVLLGVLILAITAPLLGRYDEFVTADLPLGRLAAGLGPGWFAGYAVALAAALVTTALATAYALAARLAPRRVRLASAAFLAAAVPMAGVGLTRLVQLVYPAMGIVGTVLLAGLALRAFRPR